MATKVLTAGYNIIVHQKTSAGDKPVYPYTKTANVVGVAGLTLDATLAKLVYNSSDQVLSVPTALSGSDVTDLKFLRSDNTWKTIQSATTSQAGVVQLSSALNSDSETTAATAKAAKDLKDAIDALAQGSSDTYMHTADYSFGTYDDTKTQSLAILGSDGKVTSSQLPSYVDDIVDGTYVDATHFTIAEGQPNAASEQSTGVIYFDTTSKKTYRWSGSAYVVISESLVVGTVAGTAYDGAAGQALKDKLDTVSSYANKVSVTAGTTNGCIEIDGVETTVYTLPTIDKAWVGLGDVDNVSLTGIQATIDRAFIVGKLGADPADDVTSTTHGLMTAAQNNKLANCQEILTSNTSTAPSFSSENGGLWFEIVSTDPTE